MNIDMINNADAYWLDAVGNSIVVTDEGKVYLITAKEKVVFLAEDISEIEDENGTFNIDGMDVSEYIRSISIDETSVSLTETSAKISEQPNFTAVRRYKIMSSRSQRSQQRFLYRQNHRKKTQLQQSPKLPMKPQEQKQQFRQFRRKQG